MLSVYFLNYSHMSCNRRGRHIPAPYSPPYVSHIPDMTHIRLDKSDRWNLLLRMINDGRLQRRCISLKVGLIFVIFYISFGIEYPVRSSQDYNFFLYNFCKAVYIHHSFFWFSLLPSSSLTELFLYLFYHIVCIISSIRFVIVASDGLWDFLSDEEAVATVAECIRSNEKVHN